MSISYSVQWWVRWVFRSSIQLQVGCYMPPSGYFRWAGTSPAAPFADFQVAGSSFRCSGCYIRSEARYYLASSSAGLDRADKPGLGSSWAAATRAGAGPGVGRAWLGSSGWQGAVAGRCLATVAAWSVGEASRWGRLITPSRTDRSALALERGTGPALHIVVVLVIP